jgi:hypothetical protein
MNNTYEGNWACCKPIFEFVVCSCKPMKLLKQTIAQSRHEHNPQML